MLLLLFYLGQDLYALDSAQVVEVIPQVMLRPVYQAPEYIAGLFNYRGQIVPVIDLRCLIQGNHCSFALSTRIIIVNYPQPGEQGSYLGLMAEKVTDTFKQPDVDLGLKKTHLGAIIMKEQEMIQLLQLESLLPESEQIRLLSPQKN